MFMKINDLPDDEELKEKGKCAHCGYVSEREMVLDAAQSCISARPKQDG
jgi:hypothetical protein